MDIKLANTDEEITVCFPVMHQLRPHLTRESFLLRVRSQEAAGYLLAYVESETGPVAVAGFRILETLGSGRFLNVDDLVTLDSERSKGHGASLLRWLIHWAEAESCGRLELDSALRRKDAHRFYEREGMAASAYRFAITLSKAPT